MEQRVILAALAAFAAAIGRAVTPVERAGIIAALYAAWNPAEPGDTGIQHYIGCHDAECMVRWDIAVDEEEDGYESVIIVPAPGSSFAIHDFSERVQQAVRRAVDKAEREEIAAAIDAHREAQA